MSVILVESFVLIDLPPQHFAILLSSLFTLPSIKLAIYVLAQIGPIRRQPLTLPALFNSMEPSMSHPMQITRPLLPSIVIPASGSAHTSPKNIGFLSEHRRHLVAKWLIGSKAP
jgi:hypothetical protein